ncbi:hypothetical protein OIU76_023422 [Salix suchowensis]|nr:hypothetical protein OIU76_023422 [Salix suchowensis]
MGSLDLNLSETRQFKALDPEEFRKQAHQMVDFIADYYKNIETCIPAATELEMIVVMDWLANMLKLPRKFMFSGSGGGVIQNTPSEAVLATVVAARDRVLHNIGVQNLSKIVVYGSDQTHSMFPKSVRFLKPMWQLDWSHFLFVQLTWLMILACGSMWMLLTVAVHVYVQSLDTTSMALKELIH